MLVHSSTRFQVADPNFTRFSVIPSVALKVDIPDSISGSWYSGDVQVLYKDSAFEPSSNVWHAAKLTALSHDKALTNPVLFIYSDGGPDHMVTYISVKLALIALFLRITFVRLARHLTTHSKIQLSESCPFLTWPAACWIGTHLDGRGYGSSCATLPRCG